MAVAYSGKRNPHKTNMTADIIFVIKVANLTGAALKSLRRELRALVSPGRKLILDFAGVSNIDTSGAGLLLELAEKLTRQGGHLKLVGIRERVSLMLELLRIPRAIEIHSSHTDAMTFAA